MRVKEYLHLARSQRRFGHLLASKYGLHFDPQYLNLYFQSVRVLSFYETKINIFFYRNRFADTLSFTTCDIDLENSTIPELLDEDIQEAISTIQERLRDESLG
jgi:hypothetical protein